MIRSEDFFKEHYFLGTNFFSVNERPGLPLRKCGMSVGSPRREPSFYRALINVCTRRPIVCCALLLPASSANVKCNTGSLNIRQLSFGPMLIREPSGRIPYVFY